MDPVKSISKPVIINIQDQGKSINQDKPEENPIIDVKGEVNQPEDSVKLRKVPDPAVAEEMGKTNILQWVRTNMANELAEKGTIIDIVPQKMVDEKGHAQWQLIDVKDPRDPKAEPKTCLEIQVFWVIKMKDGKERVATQFLKTGVEWPKENSAQQLEALRRATLAIDLYTHTMAQPLIQKARDLPVGFKFNDLVGFNKLYMGLAVPGPLSGRVKVEIATPGGQSGESKGLHYTLVQKIDTLGKTILGSQINFNRIDHAARHAVVKEAEGRLVNPEGRKAYKADKKMDDSYTDGIVKLDEKFYEEFEDRDKRDVLLDFMEKDRARHVVDYNIAKTNLLIGPKTPWAVRWATVKQGIANVIPFNVGPTEQQRLQRFLDYEKETEQINDEVDKLSEKIDKLEEKKEKEGLEPLEEASIENQLKSAKVEYEKLYNQSSERRQTLEAERKDLEELLLRMEKARDFLSGKKEQYLDLAKKTLALAADKDSFEWVSPSEFKKLLVEKKVQDKLTPVEKHFIRSVQKMDDELNMMVDDIKEVRQGLGLPKYETKLGVGLEEIDGEEEVMDFEGDLGLELKEDDSVDEEINLINNGEIEFEDDVI